VVGDEADVARVLNAYCYAVDALDVEAAVALFAEDCTFDWGHGRVARGHDGIRELLGSLTRWEATSHHLSNVVVEHDGPDAARAFSYVYAWHRVAETGYVEQLWGQYHDALVRGADGAWRFEHRALRAAGESGFPAASGAESNFERLPRPRPGLT
jgi:uncharacterized protein (TIGR02246 family)